MCNSESEGFYAPKASSCVGVPGADLLKLTREDVIQICGPADGIRLFNALKGRWVFFNGIPSHECIILCITNERLVIPSVAAVDRVVRPRLTIYVCQESQQAREQQPKHENGDAAANTFFGQCMFMAPHQNINYWNNKKSNIIVNILKYMKQFDNILSDMQPLL